MSEFPSRSIAVVSPHAWPPHDDLTWRIEQEARALARRGHRVSILTPATGPELLDDGRRRLRALRDGDTSAALADPGEVVVVPLGRALPAGPRRRIGGPIDLASALEDTLSTVPFDVVHIHEPLAPSPALAALRHARGVTVVTFHRPEQLAGVAFVQPLLERAMGRVDVWAATSETARRAVAEMFARDCQVIPGGVDRERFHPLAAPAGAPGLVVIARGADRAGLRFAMTVVRKLDLDAVGQVTILAPRETPWRTRASVPKALRERVVVIPDLGPDARAEAFAAGRIALVSAPDDLTSSAAREAMACGLALIVPRCAEADALIRHGTEGLALAPFSRDLWTTTVADLAGDASRRDALGAHASARAAGRSWDVVAEELETLYADAAKAGGVGVAPVHGRILADLRAHPGPELTPRQLVDACVARGIGAVAFIGEGGPEAGVEAARIARSRLLVIPGQSVRSRDGGLVGLFLRTAVPDALGLEETADAIHGQGGLVLVPHPVWAEPPSQDLLRRHRGLLDCFESLSGPAPTGRAATGVDAARLAQRFGMLTTAGSGATVIEELGSAYLQMRSFTSPREFLDALVDAEPVQRRRGLRTRVARERRRPTAPAN